MRHQHRSTIGKWIADAEGFKTQVAVTGTLAASCYSFAEATAIPELGDFATACGKEPRTVVVVRTDKGYIFGGYSGVQFKGSSGQPSATAFLFCLNCAGNPGNVKQLKHMGGFTGQQPGVMVRAPNSAPGFGLVPSRADQPLDLDLHISTKGRVAQGKSNLGEAFSCPASSEAGCLTYLAGSQYFDIVEYQAYKVSLPAGE